MIEEYVKIYCDRCGEEALVRKARFPDCIAGCYISDSGRWSLKIKVRFQICARSADANTTKCFINSSVKA